MSIGQANIVISVKQVITAIIFIFSVSGIYYKVYYQQDEYNKRLDAFILETNRRLTIIEKNQEDAHDYMIKHTAIEGSNGYLPMIKVKQ